MNTIYGTCDLSYDPISQAIVSESWTSDTKVLGSQAVRLTVRADETNTLDIPSFIRAVQLWRTRGFAVSIVFDLSINRPWQEATPRLFFPNDFLGYGGNKRHNQWILDTIRRIAGVVKALVGLGITSWCVANEPNLLGIGLHSGDLSHVHDPEKAPAMAARTFGAYAYEAALYIHGIDKTAVVEFGTFSWIATSGMNDTNPYCAEYLSTAIAFLASTGVTEFPWGAVSVNAEGFYTASTASKLRAELTRVFKLAALPDLPLIVGECGVRNDALHPQDAVIILQSLGSVATQVYLDSHQLRTPGEVGDFGARDYRIIAKQFVPNGVALPWYVAFHQVATGSTV